MVLKGAWLDPTADSCPSLAQYTLAYPLEDSHSITPVQLATHTTPTTDHPSYKGISFGSIPHFTTEPQILEPLEDNLRRVYQKMPSRSFPPGVFAPSLTWFSAEPEQGIDWDLQSKHLTYLIQSGLTGSKTK
jgi:hypothetical protein